MPNINDFFFIFRISKSLKFQELNWKNSSWCSITLFPLSNNTDAVSLSDVLVKDLQFQNTPKMRCFHVNEVGRTP